eukprot:tig00021428_g21186.t1
MDPSAMLGFDALAVDGPNPGEKAPKADKTSLPGDGPTVPPTAPSKGASFSVQEHIEMTKKKEQSVDVDEKKQVLRQIAQYRRSFGGELTSTKKLSLATPLDELKEEYEEIQRELSTRGDALFMDQVQPILEELVIKYSRYVTLGPEARLGMALVQTVLAVHAANANPEMMKEVTEAAASTAAEPRAVGGKFNGL